MQVIVELEKRGWEALSAGGEAAAEFYGNLLLDDAVMLFPGGMRIKGKASILDSLGELPWSSYRMDDTRVARPAENVAVLTYEVTAKREGGDPYKALISSTYISVDGSWKLAHHQQTPV